MRLNMANKIFEVLRKKVDEEIKNHGKTWCHPNCKPGDTFLPEAYIKARMIHGYSAKTVQGDYDLCHIFR